MDRILKATAATVSRTFYEDGVATDPGGVSVTITNFAGTAIVTGVAASGTGAAARTYNLSSAQTADLDVLTVSWVSATKGTLTSTVEIVGGFLFSLADLKAVKLGGTETLGSKFTTAQLADARTLVEQSIEDACSVAFVPRYAQETLDGSSSPLIVLRWPMVRAIRSATVGGVAVTASDLAFTPTGVLHSPSAWTTGYSNIVVTYEHGYTDPPARVAHAALRLAKRWLIEGPVDDRTTSMSNDDGTFSLMTPGLGGMLFDIPEVEAVIQQYGMRAGVA